MCKPEDGRAKSASPGFTAFPVEKFFSLDHADDKARKIIFSGRIKSRHLGGFAANQRASGFTAGAAHALNKLVDNRRVKFPHRKVIEEKKRRGALDENVVDAMIDEVAADGGVHAHCHGDFQLGADAIGARNENRLFPLLVVEREERAETADTAEDAAGESAVGVMPDALLHFVGDSDVHSGVGVFHRGGFAFVFIRAQVRVRRALCGVTCNLPRRARGEILRLIALAAYWRRA